MNLKELRDKRDVWPIVAERIPEAIAYANTELEHLLKNPDLMIDLERKFRKGEAEHGRDWLSREDANTLIHDAAEEIHDFILYQAMYVVLLQAKALSSE